jgi:zinc transport system substrate-binding protein
MQKVLFWVLALALITACKPTSNPHSKRITVSILPQKYFVKKIAGEQFTIDVLVAPGASHETYDPTPRQMMDLAKSDIYFMNGYLSFEESWKDNFKQNNPNLIICDLSTGLEVISGTHHHHGEGESCSHNGDPHFWLSPIAVKTIAANILKELVAVYPDLQDQFTNNYNAFIQEIDSLDKYAKSELSALKSTKFLIFHPALTYFAKDYGLEQVAIEVDGKNPTAKGLGEFIDMARKQNIKLILIQSQFDVQNAQAIALEIDGELVQFDPMAENWKTEMQATILKLKKALSQ